MKDKSQVTVFIDDNLQPIGVFPVPVSLELDTRKLTDGDHVLKVVSQDHQGKEGVRFLPFIVRNGPAIAIEGLRKNEVVEGVLPIMINAYGKGSQKNFLIHGSETPHSIPWWVMVGIILFVAWTGYFIISSLSIQLFH